MAPTARRRAASRCSAAAARTAGPCISKAGCRRAAARPEGGERVDLEGLIAALTPGDVASLYRNKVSTRVVLGPAFRPLQAVWSGAGEAVGEVALPDCLDGGGLDLHPILLDGCFQTVLAARDQARVAGKSTYMPFGWDRLWLAGPPPERIFCHVRMREAARSGYSDEHADDSPEIVKADLSLFDRPARRSAAWTGSR